MIILGLTYLSSNNTAACIIKDGKLVAFSEEERFNRIKHSPSFFPDNAIEFCLTSAGISGDEVNYIAVSQTYGISGNGNDELTEKYVIKAISPDAAQKIKWYPHHDCHAISSIIPSRFGKTSYITSDGFGDINSGVYGYFDGEKLNHMGEILEHRSLGGYYSHLTKFLGFKRNSEEGKTMGLASYGVVDKKLIPEFSIKPHEIVECDAVQYRDYLISMEDSDLKREIIRNILSESSVNTAATAQYYLEKYLSSHLDYLMKNSPSKNLCVAGGTFLNCTANGKISKREDVDNFFIQPASNDSGTALGSAILCFKEITGQWPEIDFNTAYWGREFSDFEVETVLKNRGVNYSRVDPSEELSILISKNLSVGYFEGKSEVGPRALCHRSILANPTSKENLDQVNIIKNREFWRPLAPVMPEEYFYQIVDSKRLSPFMLIACEVKEGWRDRIPAVTHVDNSCRPQSINRNQNPIIHSALMKFKEITGVPVFINTSFNVAGEPLVDSPDDALNTFFNSGLDALIINNFCVTKQNN